MIISSDDKINSMIRFENQIHLPNFFLTVLLGYLILIPLNSYCGGIPATPETVIMATQASPYAGNVANDIVDIPLTAVKVIRLPIGIAKLPLSVLPGVDMASGFRDIGAGVQATGDLTMKTISLPFKLAKRTTNMVTSVPGSLLGH